jgi:hypothetical protein
MTRFLLLSESCGFIFGPRYVVSALTAQNTPPTTVLLLSACQLPLKCVQRAVPHQRPSGFEQACLNNKVHARNKRILGIKIRITSKNSATYAAGCPVVGPRWDTVNGEPEKIV